MNSQFWRTGAAIAALTVFGAGQAAAETVLKLNNWLPPTHTQLTGIIIPWMAEVEKATEGRVKVQLTDASLGAPPRQYDLAVDGIADVTVGVLGYTPGRFKLAGAAELPFVGETAEELSVALWRTHEKYFAAADEYKDVELLGIYANATGHVMTTAKAGPVTSLENYAGKKFRVGGGLVQEINTALGGVNVAAPANEVYEILSQGVADGTLLPYEAVPSFNLSGVIKHATSVPGGFYSSAWFFVMNKDKFDSLPEANRQAIKEVSGEALARLAGQAQDKIEKEAKAGMEKAGVTFATADDNFVQGLREKLFAIEAKWVAEADKLGVDGKAALDYMREQVKALAQE